VVAWQGSSKSGTAFSVKAMGNFGGQSGVLDEGAKWPRAMKGSPKEVAKQEEASI